MSDDTAPTEFTPPASQEELDHIVENRLARERKKFSDYEDLKGKAARVDELEQQALTTQEKAVQEAVSVRETELNDSWSKKLAGLTAQAEARNRNFMDPADVGRYLDVSQVMKDGEVDSKALTAQLDQLAKDRPYLVQPTTEDPAPEPRRRIKRTPQEPKQETKGSRAAGLMRNLSRNN